MEVRAACMAHACGQLDQWTLWHERSNAAAVIAWPSVMPNKAHTMQSEQLLQRRILLIKATWGWCLWCSGPKWAQLAAATAMPAGVCLLPGACSM